MPANPGLKRGKAMRSVDLNADLGEGFGPWQMGDDAAMLALVTSASLACGGHAGDPETMFQALSEAKSRGVSIGAHPGYADPQGFGRRVIPMEPAAIGRMVAAQTGSLQGLAALAGARVRFVKPHGALANLAAADAAVADAIARAVADLPGGLAILAISGTQLEAAAHARGVQVFSEIFADRGYLPDGQLMPRGQAGAVLSDATEITERLTRFIESGQMPVAGGGSIALTAHSICLHGDTPGAVSHAKAVRAGLAEAGVRIAPFLPV